MATTLLKEHYGPTGRSTKDVPKRKAKLIPLATSLGVAGKWDATLPVELAKSKIDGKVILDVVSRQRGGPVDVYFVVSDREAGYAAAVPIIRALLDASSLPLDFHFLDPDELVTEP